MSGGSLDYFYINLEDHIGDFDDKELDDLVKDMVQLFHDREWYLSGDTGRGNWEEARQIFKAKWFTEHGRQDRIEHYLKEFSDEVRATFGMKTEYCQSCKHWTAKSGSVYGDCEFEKHMSRHRTESCERYERW